jgi:hypothetical protein
VKLLLWLTQQETTEFVRTWFLTESKTMFGAFATKLVVVGCHELLLSPILLLFFDDPSVQEILSF